MNKVTERFNIIVKNYRREDYDEVRPDGVRVHGNRSVSLPDSTEEVEVVVDLAGLAKHLGNKACRNRTGRAVEAGGFVLVRKVGK